MVVIALDASVSRLSIDLANRSPCAYTAPSSSSTGQQQQQHRLCCSASSLNPCSASGSFVYPYLSSFSSCSSSLSSATSASKRSGNRCASESIRSQSRRTITDLGAARKTSSRSLVSVSHGELWAGSDASQSRLAIGARPAALLNGSSNAGSVHAAIAETAAGDGLKWWERGGAPNILDVHSTEQFVHALSAAGDKLVIVEFYATWCGSCRALYPKFCKIAAEYSDVNFLKVNFDENKSMCKSLNVKVLPFFHIYRGAEGRLDSFSCSLSKLQRLKDAIAKHHDGLYDSPPEVVDDVFSTLLQKPSADISATAGGSSD